MATITAKHTQSDSAKSSKKHNADEAKAGPQPTEAEGSSKLRKRRANNQEAHETRKKHRTSKEIISQSTPYEPSEDWYFLGISPLTFPSQARQSTPLSTYPFAVPI